MNATASVIRTIVSGTEGPKVDFKEKQYDWNDKKKDNNAELAKDLMAIANTLGPNGGNGYILIGVKELSDGTGEVVGVPSSDHMNDASMHQKVAAWLSDTPRFSYYSVDVDGLSVGVFEITPGGRPYFAITAKGGLQNGVALYRNGSSAAAARPNQIIEWYREDHANEFREAEVEALRIQTTPRAALVPRSISGHDWHIYIENASLVPFTVASVRATVQPAAILWAENGLKAPDVRPLFDAEVGQVPRATFQPGSKGNSVQIVFDSNAIAKEILQGTVDLRCSDEWFDMYIVVEIEGPTGRRRTCPTFWKHPQRSGE